jgi:ATP-dependent helicase/nuclease subunit A
MGLTQSQSAALAYNRHISLTANAGSGKTYVLIQRFLKIIIEQKISLRSIAAITYTDKAAAELYTKIAKELDDLINKESVPEKRAELKTIRKQLISANISTIHSFCIDLLREYPIEAGVDANFITIDQYHAKEILELSVKEVLKKNADSPLYKRFMRILGGSSAFEEELKKLVESREKLEALKTGLYSGNHETIINSVNEKFLSIIRTILELYRPRFAQSIAAINACVLQNNPKSKTGIEIGLFISDFSTGKISREEFESKVADKIINKDGSVKKIYFKDESGDFSAELSDIQNFMEARNTIPGEAELMQWGDTTTQFAEDVLAVYNDINEIYSRRKTEGGYLDFEDLMLFTKELLKNEEVRTALAGRFQYLMIDEYQDTNEIQYEIFLPLLDELKKGNLFVVGDEKQSIYGFRNAEVSIFNRTKNNILYSGDDSESAERNLVLPDSFRMTAELCLFNNKLFQSVFKNPVALYNEVMHTDLVCAKQEDFDSKIELLLAVKDNQHDAESGEYIPEAELVARRILKLKQEVPSLQWNDVAILCARRKYFDILQSAFTPHKIPHVIAGGRGFYQNQPVYDFYNYLSFLLDNNDDAALVGILRSPFFFVDDTTIFNISCLPGNSLFDKLKAFSGEEPKIQSIISILEKHNKSAHSSSIPKIMQAILEDTPYVAILAKRADGDQQSANLEKLLTIALDYELGGYNNLYNFRSFLNQSIETDESEGYASVVKGSDAVQLMTIHQAKGLQFKAVFVFSAHIKHESMGFSKSTISIDRDLGITTKFPKDDDYFSEFEEPPHFKVMKFISGKKADAEADRLMYVALTRPKNYLFVSGEMKRTKTNPDGTITTDSPLGKICRHLKIDYTLDSHSCSGSLQVLEVADDETYINKTKNIAFSIPIIHSLPEAESASFEAEKAPLNFIVNTEPVPDTAISPVISATQYVTYMQCPMKYHLRYRLHLDDLIPVPKRIISSTAESSENSYDGASDESGTGDIPDSEELLTQGFAEKRGIILHALLEKEVPPEQIEYALKNILAGMPEIKDDDKDFSQIAETYASFVKSETYTDVVNLGEARKEFDIQTSEGNYYLQGKIDRFIKDGNKVYIIDYKSNSVDIAKLRKLSGHYSHQLAFYAFIAAKLFPDAEIFETRIVYVMHPEESVTKIYSKNQLGSLKKNVDSLYQLINGNACEKNLVHCPECVFAVNRKTCVFS